MRENSFPDYYTEWDTLRDIKSGDIENVKAYLSAINDNNYIKAGVALAKLKNKVLLTADWQERFDTVCEMHLYMDTVTEANNYNQTLHVVNTTYEDKLPSGAETPTERMKPIVGNLWFDTSYGIIPCTKLTASTTSITLYKYQSGIVYVDIIPVPYNTTDTIALSTTTAGVSLKDKGRRLALDSNAMALTTTYKNITVKITTAGRTSISVTIKVYVLPPLPATINIIKNNLIYEGLLSHTKPTIYLTTDTSTHGTKIWDKDTSDTKISKSFSEGQWINIEFIKYTINSINVDLYYTAEIYVNGALQKNDDAPSDSTEEKLHVLVPYNAKNKFYNITFDDRLDAKGYLLILLIYIYTTEI